MPELPEVETIKRQLAAEVVGKRWLKLHPKPCSLFKTPPRFLSRNLAGARLEAVGRRGKFLLLQLEPEWVLIVHLGMSGQILLIPPAGMPSSHCHLRVSLEDGRHLVFRDPRRFGRIQLARPAEMDSLKTMAKIGIDPFDPGFTWELFSGFFKRRGISIKALLMDQQAFSGIGNIYADEILFRSRIRPQRPAADLSKAEIKDLFHVVKDTLSEACRHGGTSFDEAYVDLYGKPGLYGGLLNVYGREGETCRACHTILRSARIGGRGSVYCPHCQK